MDSDKYFKGFFHSKRGDNNNNNNDNMTNIGLRDNDSLSKKSTYLWYSLR